MTGKIPGRHHGNYLAVLAAVLLAATAYGAAALATYDHPTVVALMLALAVPYAGAAWLVLRGPGMPRWALPMILATAALARAVLLPWPPVSTDIYRYVWDGRVQAAGINPYRYVPNDPALAHLRDPEVHPRINRADYAPTIYPPAAQLVFLAVAAVKGGVVAMKAAMVAFEALTAVALMSWLAARGLPRERVLIYAWHPLPLFEFAGSGHVDAVLIALTVLAFALAECGWRFAAGLALAGGTLVKFAPLASAPALWRRGDWRAPAAFLAGVALLYAPYLGAGRAVLGFLPGYAAEEGLSSGEGVYPWWLLRQLLPMPERPGLLYAALAAAVLGTLALGAVLRLEPARTSAGWAMALLVALTVIASPQLPWYFAWGLPLLALRPSLAVFYLTLAAPLLYGMVHEWGWATKNGALYIPFFALLMFELITARRRPKDTAPWT